MRRTGGSSVNCAVIGRPCWRGGCSNSMHVLGCQFKARVVVASRLPRHARSCAWLTSACGDLVSVSHDRDAQRELVQGLGPRLEGNWPSDSHICQASFSQSLLHIACSGRRGAQSQSLRAGDGGQMCFCSLAKLPRHCLVVVRRNRDRNSSKPPVSGVGAHGVRSD
jgi:hypothetical protein